MRARAVPREIPDSLIYLEVVLPQGIHHFRVPSQIVGARLLGALPPEALAALQRAGAGSPDALLAALREVGVPALQIAGAAIASAWFHREIDLEAAELKGESPLAYGERVYEEIYEAGYSLDSILRVAVLIATEWLSQAGVAAEALRRADFFGRPKGSNLSGRSTSASGSSEIPGGSSDSTPTAAPT